MADKRRPAAEMTLPFDSLIIGVYRFRWKFGIRVQNLGSRNVISYQRDPQNALPFSKPRRLSQHACKSVKAVLQLP